MKTAPAKLSKNQLGVQAIAKTMSVLILVAGVIYCEVMFLSMVSTAFPAGLLRIFASIGAIVGGMSVLLLLLAKSFWFTEGVQLIFSYVFTGAEVLFLVANTILAFELNSGKTVDSYLVMWETFAPATPVVAIVGWTIIWSLDASAKRRHALTNIEDDEHEAELDYRRKVHQARIGLRDRFLTQVIADMEEDIQSEHIRGQGKLAASQLAAAALTEVTGLPVVPRLKTDSSVESSGSVPALTSGAPGKRDRFFGDQKSITFRCSRCGTFRQDGQWQQGIFICDVCSKAAEAQPGGASGDLEGGEWDDADQWLSQVNARVERERAQRLSSESDLGDEQEQRDEQDMPRLRQLAATAAAAGYTLDRMERFFGLSSASGALDEDTRLVRILEAAQKRGYTLDRLEQLLGGSSPMNSDGGDGSKKK